MTKIEPRLLKGFRDYNPKEQAARQAMFSKIQNVFERFGFLPLSTPVLEYKDILMGKYGEGERLLYSFKDNGERDVAMRYDLTVPLARYIAQNINQLTFPFKRYQIAPVWRADNPQRGRLREFYQCDIDAVGVESNLADAEVIACACKALEGLGVSDYVVRINDRRVFDRFSVPEDQKVEIMRSIDKYDKIGLEGVVQELREKNMDADIVTEVEQFLQGSFVQSDNASQNVQQIIELLQGLGIPKDKIKADYTIARGLDYYTSSVFEIFLPGKEQYGSVASGGRYDQLLNQFSDKVLPAVGISIGIDRLFEALEDIGLLPNSDLVKVLVLNQDEQYLSDYVRLTSALRDNGINTELYYESVKLDKQFKYAENKGIAYAIILGEKEKVAGTVQLKNLQTREQQEISERELIDKLK
jgi:histidyl-tRNA synthetase